MAATAAWVGASLSAASALGAGTAIEPATPAIRASMQAAISGGGEATVALQGSIDGTNWRTIGQKTSSQPTFVVNSDANQLVFQQFRANLISLSGGTNSTVTAYIAIAPSS